LEAFAKDKDDPHLDVWRQCSIATTKRRRLVVVSADTVDEPAQEVALEHDVRPQLLVVGDVRIKQGTKLRDLVDEPCDGLSFGGWSRASGTGLAVCPSVAFVRSGSGARPGRGSACGADRLPCLA
jgi:hypothetical protein